jgi:hypothetical protein
VAFAWATALVLGAGAFVLARHAYDTLPRPQPLQELSYYPSGEHLRPATLGHAESVADLAWLRAVQYYGEHRRTDLKFTHLSHVFDVLTSLSPRFVPAYVFGAFTLAQEGREFERAETLMLRGLEQNPHSGVLAFELGFLYYVRPGGRDLRRAGEMFERAARCPDGPPQSTRFAAYSRQHAGDLRVAYEMWQVVAETSGNRYLKDIAEREMAKIREALAAGRPERAVRRLTTPQVIIR